MDVHETNWLGPDGKNLAHQKLTEYVNKQQLAARSAVSRVFSDVPEDRIVPAKAVHFNELLAGGGGPFQMAVGNADPAHLTLHENAVQQMAARLEMPGAYATELHRTGQPWASNLLANNFNTLLQNRADREDRYLVRSVRGQARAVLSDHYRRLDSRPILDALMGAATENGAMLVDGYSGDVKVCAKFISPTIVEPVPGEFMVFGLSWTNSDYGRGANELDSFFVRLVCLNGAIASVEMRKIHLGGRLQDGVQYSDETYRLDTEALASAVRDSARFLLSEARVNDLAEAIKRANAEPADGKVLVERFKKAFTKKESERLAEIYNGADVVNLPAGNTAWRFSNAVSFLAHEVPDGERALDMQKWAGHLVAA